jgi:hypothetical protein
MIEPHINLACGCPSTEFDQPLVSSGLSVLLNLMNGVSDYASLDNDFCASSVMSRGYLPVADVYTFWEFRDQAIKISLTWTVATLELHAERLGSYISILQPRHMSQWVYHRLFFVRYPQHSHRNASDMLSIVIPMSN